MADFEEDSRVESCSLREVRVEDFVLSSDRRARVSDGVGGRGGGDGVRFEGELGSLGMDFLERCDFWDFLLFGDFMDFWDF